MKSKMRYRQQRFDCGSFTELNIFPVFECRTSPTRHARRKPSKQAQQALNQKNREREVNRVICANFSAEDYYVTLTFREQPDLKAAEYCFRRFLTKLNRLRASQDLPRIKYVKTLEVGSRSGRIHFHLVISGKGITPKDIADLWSLGYVDVRPLQFCEDGCAGLSRYFVKAKKDGGDKFGTLRRSWSCSRNCERPKPKNNDGKFSKRSVCAIAESGEAENIFRKLYPDHEVATCEEFFRDETGLYYIYVRLYRKGTKLSI